MCRFAKTFVLPDELLIARCSCSFTTVSQEGEKSEETKRLRAKVAEECEDAAGMSKWSAGRPWRLWLREVEASPLYVNQA